MKIVSLCVRKIGSVWLLILVFFWMRSWNGWSKVILIMWLFWVFFNFMVMGWNGNIWSGLCVFRMILMFVFSKIILRNLFVVLWYMLGLCRVYFGRLNVVWRSWACRFYVCLCIIWILLAIGMWFLMKKLSLFLNWLIIISWCWKFIFMMVKSLFCWRIWLGGFIWFGCLFNV